MVAFKVDGHRLPTESKYSNSERENKVYNAVTLGDEDVEWIRPDDHRPDADLINIWCDTTQFNRYLLEHGVHKTTWEALRLHRKIANQLIARDVMTGDETDWARRTVGLCSLLRRRRGRMRALYRVTYGPDAMALLQTKFDAVHPRAERGTKPLEIR